MTAGRAVLRARWRQFEQEGLRADPKALAVVWGRIGAYEAVSRDGILFLLTPDRSHPARRVGAQPRPVEG